jgi:hypothetical protein
MSTNSLNSHREELIWLGHDLVGYYGASVERA